MSRTRHIVQRIAEKVEMSPEDREALRKIRQDRARVAGWHPGDDHPFQGADGYSGYNVRDARSHMTRIKQDIEAKYGIKPKGPSQSQLAREEQKRQKRKEIEAKVKEKFPKIDAAYDVLWKYDRSNSYTHPSFGRGSRTPSRGPSLQAVFTRALRQHGFKNVSDAARYRAMANKFKGELLRKAGLRPNW